MATEDENELIRLAKLIKVTRAAQKRYFAGDHSPAVMGQCRDLERRLDKAADWVLDHRQGELFPAKDPAVGPYRQETIAPRSD